MISIRKYLDRRDTEPFNQVPLNQVDSAPTDPLVNLCSSLFDDLNEFVLNGDSFDELRTKIVLLKNTVTRSLAADEALRIGDSVRVILAGHGTQARETVQHATVEMQHIVEVLNQALVAVADGSGRSISRLQKIQQTLHRTSMIQDVGALRASLADTLHLIQTETIREKEESARDLAAFEAETLKVREFLAENPKRQLPGRPEGVRGISEALKCVQPDKALYLVAFLFQQLKGISLRYGAEAADELVFRIIKERIQPVAPSNTAYRWTPQSLVGIFQRTRDLSRLKAEMMELNRSPLTHRITLGNRTAVIKVGLSHLVAEGAPDSAEILIEEVDRFTGIAT